MKPIRALRVLTEKLNIRWLAKSKSNALNKNKHGNQKSDESFA
jgi:hypothetical protein